MFTFLSNSCSASFKAKDTVLTLQAYGSAGTIMLVTVINGKHATIGSFSVAGCVQSSKSFNVKPGSVLKVCANNVSGCVTVETIHSAGHVPGQGAQDNVLTVKPYLATIPLLTIGTSYNPPSYTYKSLSFYVKQGEVRVSDDGGATFSAAYDSSDPSVSLSNGTTEIIDVSLLIIESTVDDTIIQVIGETV